MPAVTAEQEQGSLGICSVACQLLKFCHYTEDTQGHRTELRFLRDTDGREVDFVVLKDKRPTFAVEVKTGDRGLSPSLRYFKERTGIPQWARARA
jgi:hypothetical protein